MGSRKYMVAIIGLVLLCSQNVAAGSTVSFRDGFPAPFLGGTYAGTDDTMLVRNPTGAGSRHNFGARPYLQVGHVPVGARSFDRYGLIRFDVTALAGQFQSIDSVTLRLFVSNTDAGLEGRDVTGSGTLQVFELATANQGWEEGTGTFFDASSPVTPGMTTWDQRLEGAENWFGSPGAGTSGVDYLAPALASRSFQEADEELLEGSSFDLTLHDTSLVADWVDGDNAGLLLRTRNPNVNNSITFFTNNALESAYRPELIVEFTPIPEPTTVVSLGMAMLVISLLRSRE